MASNLHAAVAAAAAAAAPAHSPLADLPPTDGTWQPLPASTQQTARIINGNIDSQQLYFPYAVLIAWNVSTPERPDACGLCTGEWRRDGVRPAPVPAAARRASAGARCMTRRR